MATKKKCPRWLLVLLIPGGIMILVALINGVFGLFGHHGSPSVFNSIASSNLNGSAVVSGNQNGNNTFYNAQNAPINIYNNANPSVETNLAEWQPPELPAGCQFVSIVSGGNEITRPIGKDGGAINLVITAAQDANGAYRAIPIIGGHVSANRFFADVTIPGDFPFGSFKLSGNKIDGHLPPLWDMNYDANAIEIVNNDEVTIYQIIYRRPDVMEIYGVFMAANSPIIVSRHEMERMKVTSPTFTQEWLQSAPAKLQLKRIFKYPSSSYIGKRVQRDE